MYFNKILPFVVVFRSKSNASYLNQNKYLDALKFSDLFHWPDFFTF